MKKIAGFTTLFLLLAIITGTHAQTVDEIVNKHIEARGGLDKIHSLQSLSMEGTLVQMGNEVEIKYYQVHNKGMKIEFSLMDQSGYSIITPTAGWSYNPFAGNTAAESIPEDQVKLSQISLDLHGPLVDYQSKGNKVEYLGKEKVNGADCYKMKVTRSSGKTGLYYLDAGYMLVKSVTPSLVNGAEQEVTTEYSDYRKSPEGYLVAYKRSSAIGDITFSKVTFNPVLADNVFKPSN